MSKAALKALVDALQTSVEKMGTFGAHQSVLLGLLEKECDSPEQEALLYALRSCNVMAFEGRVDADSQIEEIGKALETLVEEGTV